MRDVSGRTVSFRWTRGFSARCWETARLSGGSIVFSTADMEMLDRLRARAGGEFELRAAGGYDWRVVQARGHHRAGVQGVTPNGIKEALVGLGLWGIKSEEKFIPSAYLAASYDARLDLLRGLLDTDGWVERWGSMRFCSSSERLARDVVELVRSLGGWCTVRPKRTTYTYLGVKREGRSAYVCNIHHDDPKSLVLLTHKQNRALSRPVRAWRPVFVSIEPTRVAETRCISVTHPSGLYITDDYVVTHNTSLAMNIAEHVALDTGLPVGIFSMEMASTQLVMRMLGSVGKLDQHRLRTGRLQDQDWQRLTEAVGKLNDAPMHIDETAALNPLELRARARRLAPAVQAARPDRSGLPAAHVRVERRREPRHGAVRDLAFHEGTGEGARLSGDRAVAAQPQPGAAAQQAAGDVGSCASA